ncbi:MAG TPA: hypothetical protein VGK26_08730 [Thermoanaerobaculia bacterium]|jgi:hypothetical protein
MSTNDDGNRMTHVCRNENCVRPAEPGESYCATCGLEISLFVRDLRPRRAGAEPRRPIAAPRA